ncbi:MAG: 3-oxoadipate enol-lactonase, partial [Candidatus Rokuibacteriota bacterium]
TVNYALEGPATAPVVIVSHSLAAHLGMWEPQVAALTRTFRVLRYDTRGHGGTEVTPGAYTLDQLAADALGLLDALDIERAHWLGLSLGGMIGQTLALKAPGRLRSLVLCDTTSRVPSEAKPLWEGRIRTAEAQGMEPLVEPTIERWFTAPFRQRRPEVIDRVRTMIRETDPRGYAGCCHAIAALDLTDRLSAIRLPALVVVGEDDLGTPVAAARTMHEHIKGSELVVIPAAAHLSNIEQPEAFSNAVVKFLGRVV